MDTEADSTGTTARNEPPSPVAGRAAPGSASGGGGGRRAMRRIADAMVAPQAGAGEIALTFAAAGTGAAAVLAAGAAAGWTGLAVAVAALVAFDYFGGAVANATASAKRRFHGPGRGARHRLGFVAMHLQPAAVAWAVPGFGWADAAAVYALTLAAAVVVELTGPDLRRPAAFAAATLGIAAALALLSVPPQVAWLAPVGLIKLLLGHLVPGEGPAVPAATPGGRFADDTP
ncbi:hypothetical protein [Streptomonospora wellingtoniae]|uniref:Uncharacterized protein n=1 Tax=Streptomonospora wellingtoniae TaxID=3075544 RepID=A0ABU2KNH1_9ACTN|nr:hypothetical protein [Streptomonospora sp. DSM 45055]MDT0300820.1 hypothetical protein [Streptomonospora sp. DSM 45055]